jgi:hypothetical protein
VVREHESLEGETVLLGFELPLQEWFALLNRGT